MRTVFADAAPIAEIRGGMVYLRWADEAEPAVAVPIHVARKFCELTMRTLNDWEREQTGRQPVPFRKVRNGAPISHG